MLRIAPYDAYLLSFTRSAKSSGTIAAAAKHSRTTVAPTPNPPTTATKPWNFLLITLKCRPQLRQR